MEYEQSSHCLPEALPALELIMHTMLRLLLLLLLSSHLMAMDGSDPSANSDQDERSHPSRTPSDRPKPKKTVGLMLKNAQDFCYQRQQWHRWTNQSVKCVLWWTAGASALFLELPGIVVSSLYCRNYQARRECIAQCQDHWGCENNCNNNLNFQTMSHPGCVTGMNLVFFPIGATLLAMCSNPITWLQNKFVDQKNAKLSAYLSKRFLRNRPDNQLLTQQDIKDIAHFLFLPEAKPLAQELSPAQALSLAEVDLARFEQLAINGFNEATSIIANKLLRLLDMDGGTLGDALNQKDGLAVFMKEPALWQALVRCLPENIKNHKLVNEGLIGALKAIHGNLHRSDEDYFLKTMGEISNGELDMDNILSQVTVDTQDICNDDQITLLTGTDSFLAGKRALSEISEFFARASSDSWQKDSINLSDTDPAWVEILLRLAKNEAIAINEKNLWTMLSTANYFIIQKLFDLCDTFILEGNFLAEATAMWEKNEKIPANSNAWDQSFHFCDQFRLQKNKIQQAKILLSKLSQTLAVGKPNRLSSVRLLSEVEINAALNQFDTVDFLEKLTQAPFLSWIWKNAKDIGFLKKLIVQFCAEKSNASIVEKAWFSIPDDLKEAVLVLGNT